MDKIAKELGMTPEELERFDQASNHPFDCHCDMCKEWWDAVGPEE